MPFVELSQVLVVLGFLGVLFALQHLVRRNREGLRGRLIAEKRLQLIEALAVGTGERILLVSLDGRECLVHSARNASSLIVLEKRTEE